VVANPGCFPTSAILPLAPLVREGLIEPSDIIIDSKTGVSGGGRTPKPAFHYPECNESVSAYAVGTHRHGPEINQIVRRSSKIEIESVFVPHLIPMTRGILSTIYGHPVPGVTAQRVQNLLTDFYRDSGFVRITDSLPGTRDVSGTNFCDITVRTAGHRIAIVSAIDNLIKGASGAAVQNMNIMFGLSENMAL
jgi:N-acetyl-gamma-glutamyl-phosphate reductase